jgi:hypothetical protein
MMSGDEAQQIRHIVHQELADIEGLLRFNKMQEAAE